MPSNLLEPCRTTSAVRMHRTSSNLVEQLLCNNEQRCKQSVYKNQAFMEFLFHHEFIFEIEPHGPPLSVCFCTIGPSQIRLGENKKKKRMKVEQSASVRQA